MKKKHLTKKEMRQALYFIWEWQEYVSEMLAGGAEDGYFKTQARRDSKKATELETTIRLLLEAKPER